MRSLIVLALLVAVVAAHGNHRHHDHDHDHDHNHDGHSHDHHDHDFDEHVHHLKEESESEQGVLATFQRVTEWVLIVIIAGLVVYIIRMLVFGSSSPSQAVYKPKRAPPKVFLTREELALHDGRDPKQPVYVGIRGVIFDVSSKRSTYGIRGQGYNMFAGRDAARALAKSALDEETCLNPNISDLTKGELDTLEQWETSFRQKYPVAGEIVASAEEKQKKEAEEKKRYDLETARLEAEESAASKSKL